MAALVKVMGIGLMLALAPVARAESLCRLLLASASIQSAGPGEGRGGRLVEEILSLAQIEFADPELHPEEYGAASNVYVSRGLPGATFHPVSDGRYGLVLQLPPPGEPTVWGALTGKERTELAVALEHAFRTRKSVDLSNALFGIMAQVLGRTVTEETDRSEWRLELPFERSGGRYGLSPRLLLVRGRDADDELTNFALAGLLLELGASRREVRVMKGREAPGDLFHYWVEVRPSAASAWLQLEPTPDLTSPLGSTPPRRRFRVHQREVSEFFSPL